MQSYDVVVIGSGPTGAFAAYRLAHLGAKVVLVGARRPMAIEPVRVGDGLISVVPILPPLVKSFPPSFGPTPPLEVQYVGDPESLIHRQFSPGSFAERNLNNPLTLVLAAKQFGPAVWSQPLAEVQAKIERSYMDGRTAARSGYLPDGTSPYWPSYREALASLEPLDSDVQAWDRPGRRLVLRTGAVIRYKRAVVTVPLWRAMSLIGRRVVVPTVLPAAFMVLKTQGHVAQRLIYHLDANSPIFRVLTPTATVAVVQLSLAGQDYAVRARQQAIGLVESLCETRVLTAPLLETEQLVAYPVEPLGAETLNILQDLRDDDGILLYGRYATHRYLDLHELPWHDLMP